MYVKLNFFKQIMCKMCSYFYPLIILEHILVQRSIPSIISPYDPFARLKALTWHFYLDTTVYVRSRSTRANQFSIRAQSADPPHLQTSPLKDKRMISACIENCVNNNVYKHCCTREL